MSGAIRRTLAVVALVGTGVAGAACSDSSESRPDVDDLRGDFGGDTVSAATGLLADANIEVRVRPRDEPVATVESASPVRLLRFQVRNLALEANVGGGALGAELDAVATAADGDPVSTLIAGWAQTAGTPAADTAAALLADVDDTDPRHLTIPGLVVALFLGDLTGPTGSEPAAAPTGGFLLGPAAGGADDDDDFCADVSAYLAAALADILDPEATFEPRWLRDAVDRYAAFEPDPQRLRNSVAAMSLYVYATSVARPWVPLLVVNPLGGFHHRVGENEIPPTTEIRLSVDTGDEYFAEEAEDCAALAGLQVPDVDVEGTDVGWLTQGLLPHVTVDDEGPGGDLELDENGSAIWEFEPVVESADAHKNGTQQTVTIPVGAVVIREEIAEVRTLVRDLLTGGELGVAEPEVVAAYERLEPTMDQLLYPRASAYATVTWHTPKPPDEEDGIGEGGAGCGAGCAASNGDPHLVPLSGLPYDFQAAGEFVLIRSAEADVEIQARQVPVGDESDLTLNAAIAARVGEHRIGIYAEGDGIATRLDGEAVSITEEIDLGDGARIAPHELGVEVEFRDGSVLWAIPRRGAVEILVNPSDQLRTTATGLLGRSTDEGYGLPALPDGSAVPAPTTRREAFALLYGDYEDAWQVTTDSSLFDYEQGESPDSFLVDDFPVRPLEYEDLTPEQLAAGSEACDGVDLLPELRQSCILDVVVTGDPTYAEMYERTGDVIAEASDGLGDPGPLIDALPAEELAPSDEGTVTVTESEPEAPVTIPPVAVRSGEPTLTLTGTLVAVSSDAAFDDGVETEMSGSFSVTAGTVMVARIETCPPSGLVYMDVENVEQGESAVTFPCDPDELHRRLMDEDDEAFDGESYVWLTHEGDYQVTFSVDTESATPITVDVFADPSPTIVGQDAVLDGDETTLSGIGDTLVYEFDGTSADAVTFVSTGLTDACALDAYGAPELGDGAIWPLAFCGHTGSPGAGLSNSGLYVPVVVFARTSEPIDVTLAPSE